MKKILKITISVALVFLTVTTAVGCGKKSQVEQGNTAQMEQGDPAGRPGMFRQRSPEEIKASLAPLVTGGTITQQQADSVVSFFEKQAEERKNMNPEDPRAQREGNQGQRPEPGQRPNPLGELVSSGTITQEQADKIAEVLFNPQGTNQTNSGN